MAVEWFDDLTNSLGELAVKGATAYSTIKGANSTSSEEEAYLRGQLNTVAAYQQMEADKGTLKIGGAEISTSSVLWIIGGTLGLMFIGFGLKKFIK